MPRALLVSPDGLLGAARPDLAVIAVMARLAHPVVAHVWAASASRVVALRCTTDELLARAESFLSVYTSELCPEDCVHRSSEVQLYRTYGTVGTYLRYGSRHRRYRHGRYSQR